MSIVVVSLSLFPPDFFPCSTSRVLVECSQNVANYLLLNNVFLPRLSLCRKKLAGVSTLGIDGEREIAIDRGKRKSEEGSKEEGYNNNGGLHCGAARCSTSSNANWKGNNALSVLTSCTNYLHLCGIIFTVFLVFVYHLLSLSLFFFMLSLSLVECTGFTSLSLVLLSSE